MNIYQKGKATLKFDAMEFDFADQVLAAISDYSLSLDGEAINSLEVTHKVPNIKNNLENCRQVLFSLFRTSGFQEKFKHLGAQLIDEHFNGVGLLQKTPTVRIQIPGAESTSYHSDGWYGHGASVKSFWMPLTKVTAGNTLYMAKDAKESEDCLHNIISAKANLRDINSIAKQVCEPFEGGLGDILTFTSAMIHGANKNTLDYTRVSFDFRIAPDPDDIGSKPRSNFFSRQELDNEAVSASLNTPDETENYKSISYSNLCGGVSAKSQLMLCAAFCEANGIGIVANESEIVSLDYLPVMQHYLSEQMNEVDSIVVFSTGVFNKDKKLANQMLDCAKRSDKKIIFCAEGIVFGKDSNNNQILDLI